MPQNLILSKGSQYTMWSHFRQVYRDRQMEVLGRLHARGLNGWWNCPLCGCGDLFMGNACQWAWNFLLQDHCLSQCSIAVKSCCQYGNSYSGWLAFQRFGPLSSWWEAWQEGRHGAGDIAWEFYIWMQRHQEERTLAWLEHLKPWSPPPMTLLQQDHTS